MRISAYWRKAFRDLWENKPRALLVILALVVGVVSVGMAAATYSILIREMDKNYLSTNPASATLWVYSLDDNLVQTVADMPQIDEAEARSEITGRIQIAPGEWRELWLFVIPDFDAVQIDTFTPEKGAWPPATSEILLERTAVEVADVEIGDTVVVKIPGREAQPLSFTGTVHARGLPPASIESRVYGYITPETLALLGGDPTPEQLKITVAEHGSDKAYIRETAYELKAWLEENGHTVSRIDIPEPGKHPFADLMAAFMGMLGAFGVLALIMSSILVTNMFSALLAQHIRQIGIMKAIGGSIRQIVGIYLMMVLVLGLIALVIGLPISLALGRVLANYQAVNMLNFDIYNYRVDLWAYGLIVVMGLLIPLLASTYPIYSGSQKTVLEALTDYGVRQGQAGTGRIDVWLSKVTGIARPLLLSMRNAFRRRSRLILTLVTLTVGGANFATAINVASSLNATVASKFDAIPYDIDVAFSQSYPQDQIEQVVSQVEGVERVETWGGALSNIVLPDGTLGEDLRLIALPVNSQLMPDITIREGRWLRPDDQNAIVINDTLLKKLELDAAVGDEIELDINGVTTTWQLVGISWEYLSSTAYVPFDALAQTLGQEGQAANIVVQTSTSTDEVAKNLEIQLSNAGFDVSTLWKTADTRLVFKMHMLMITVILLAMAALFVLVGGLGLASAIGLNVLERTRELGILRAIGASTQRVLQIITLEGAFIGILSWMFAILLSLPLTWGMTQIFDKAFDMPVKLTISGGGWLLWLLVVGIISILASIIPAWNAARRPVDEVLAYE